MISKPKARFIKSLQVKKYRLAEQCFLVQGAKAVKETLTSDYRVITLCGTGSFLRDTMNSGKAQEVIEVSEKELTALGSVDVNTSALAIVQFKSPRKPLITHDSFTLVLDDIRDPGNLGTIIRTADWYGLTTILASQETTDMYSPKVINATMGSFLRVAVHYDSLPAVLATVDVPVYGTFLDGENVHTTNFEGGGLIIIGNESRGISPEVERFVTRRITIPRMVIAESLNASVATGIVLDNIRRRS